MRVILQFACSLCVLGLLVTAQSVRAEDDLDATTRSSWCFVDTAAILVDTPNHRCGGYSLVSGSNGYVGYEADFRYHIGLDSTGRVGLRYSWGFSALAHNPKMLFYCKNDHCKPLGQSEISGVLYSSSVRDGEVCVSFTNVYKNPADRAAYRIERMEAVTKCFAAEVSYSPRTVYLDVWGELGDNATHYEVWIKDGPSQLSDDEVADEVSYDVRAMGGIDWGLHFGAASVNSLREFAGGADVLVHAGLRFVRPFALQLAFGYQYLGFVHGGVVMAGFTLQPGSSARIRFVAGPGFGSERPTSVSDFATTVELSSLTIRGSIAWNVAPLSYKSEGGLRVGIVMKAVYSWRFEERWTFLGGLEFGIEG